MPVADRVHAIRVREGDVSVNPFDDENGTFFVLVNDEEQQQMLSKFHSALNL